MEYHTKAYEVHRTNEVPSKFTYVHFSGVYM